jgi:5-formyltetrahydrofolate cyclo-ligase
MILSVSEQKQKLRVEMRAKRSVDIQKNPNASSRLASLLTADLKVEEGWVVSAYHPFRDEMDPGPAMEKLRALGARTALPVLTKKGEPLMFRLWEPGDPMILNGMGIMEPLDTAPLTDPDMLLVPLLAFDRAHNRLGYGGGFYDRTLAGLRVRKTILAIGIGYACQEVPEVPTEPWDGRLDRIATEAHLF